MKELKLGINLNVSNAEYHSDRTRLSSSDLKTLLKNPEQFYKEKILGQKEQQEEKAHFTEGSYLHSLILEPENTDKEFIVFDGLRKQGKDFDLFKLQNPGLSIISQPQALRCKSYYKAFKQRKEAVELISGGFAEHTMCVDIDGVPIKVRCDYINPDKGYIADVKTSSFPVDLDSFRVTVDKWQYQLSAALYCQAAKLIYGKDFDFYFVAISKNDSVCELFKLSSEKMHEGQMLVAKALAIYRQCLESNDWTNKQNPDIITSDYEILEV